MRLPFKKQFFDRRWMDAILVLFFGVVIFVPAVNMGLKIIPEAPSQENRVETGWPEFSWDTLIKGEWQKGVTSFLNDHFGLRNHMVGLTSKMNIHMFKVSPSDQVVIGSEGWLYYASEHALEDYRVTKPFTEDDLAKIKKELLYRQSILAKQEIDFAILFVPNKHTIYPEFIPKKINRVDKISRLDQLLSYLEGSGLNLVDVRKDLLKAKEEEILYYKTDTHWNHYGAFLAYQKLAEKLELEPLALDQFEKIKVECPAGDLAGLIFMKGEMMDECVLLNSPDGLKAEPQEVDLRNPSDKHELVAFGSTNQNRKAVVFRDSFADAVIPYLSEHFARSVYVWDYDLHLDIVEAEKPDVVILEILERYIYKLIPGGTGEY